MTDTTPKPSSPESGLPNNQLPTRVELTPPLTPALQNGPVGWIEPDGEDEGLQLSGLLHSLRRRWPLGTAVGFSIASAVALALWILIPVTYRAKSLVHVQRLVEKPIHDSSGREMTAADFDGFRETQAVLVSSETILQRALQEPNLLRLSFFENHSRSNSSDIELLRDKLSVGYIGLSDLMQIGIRTEEPQEAMNIVNAVTRVYLEEVAHQDNLENSQNVDQLKSSFLDIERDINRKTDLLLTMQEENGTSEYARRLQEAAQFEIDRLLLERVGLRQLITELGSEIHLREIAPRFQLEPTHYEILDHMELNSTYAEAQLYLKSVQNNYDYLVSLVPPGSSTLNSAGAEVVAAQESLEVIYRELEPRIVERILRVRNVDDNTTTTELALSKIQLQMFQVRFATLSDSIETAQEEAKHWGQTTAALEALDNEVITLTELKNRMHTQLQLHRVNQNNISRIQLMQPAALPTESTIVTKVIEIFFAWLGLFVASVLGFVAWDYFGKRVNLSEDVTRNTQIHVIGSMPQLKGGGLLRFGRPPLELQLNQSIDSIRASLMYAKRDKPIEIVLVTSATGQEGKTTVASQLAMSLARSGRRTLLLDGDIRNPQQARIFGLEEGPGLGELLKGEARLDDILQPTAAENLWLAAAGSGDSASLKALMGDAFPKFVQEARSRFDFIVLDSSPVLTGADTLLLGQFADATILSVRRDVSRTNKIEAAADRLRSVGIEIMGAVLNGSSEEMRKHSIALEMIESDESTHDAA